jgi:ABC-type transport system involved in cytochrome c biogenesis permease component
VIVEAVREVRRALRPPGGSFPFHPIAVVARADAVAVRRKVRTLSGWLVAAQAAAGAAASAAYALGWFDRPAGAGPLPAGVCYAWAAAGFALSALVAPAIAAGAVSDDRERGSLDLLRLTDVRPWELVAGRTTSRVAVAVLVPVAIAPGVVATWWLSAADGRAVGWVMAAAAVTAASGACGAVLASLYAARTRAAVTGVYGLAAAYVCGSAQLYYLSVTGLATDPLALRAVGWATAADPLATALRAFGSAGDPAGPAVRYLAVHAALAAAAAGWAAFRAAALIPREPGRRAKGEAGGRRRAVGERPFVWKEVVVDRGLRLGWAGRVVSAALLVFTVGPAAAIGFYLADEPDEQVAEAMGYWVRLAGALVATAMTVAVAVRAAAAVSGERDRRTLDGLLLAPDADRALVPAKLVGSVCGVRWWAVLLLAVWEAGVYTGGLSAAAVPGLAAACGVYAGFAAALGLWFSVTSPSTPVAVARTLAAGTALAVGHWVVWLGCGPVVGGWRLLFDLDPARFQAGLTPPLALAWLLPFRDGDFARPSGGKELWQIVYPLVGLACWAAGAAALAVAAGRRLRPAPVRHTPPAR